jgi:hypothetical protein
MTTSISPAMTYDDAVYCMNQNANVVCIMTHENGFLAFSRDAMFGITQKKADTPWYVVYTGTLPLPLHIAYATQSQMTHPQERPPFSYEAMTYMYDAVSRIKPIDYIAKPIDYSAGIAQKTGVGATQDEPTPELHIINPS